ncbi:unnamed protein product [Closterium sp. NIES-53]
MVPCSLCAPRRTIGPFLFFYPSCAPWHWHATGLSAPALPEAAPDPSAPTPFRRSAAFFLPTPLSSFVSLQLWGGGYGAAAGGGGCEDVGEQGEWYRGGGCEATCSRPSTTPHFPPFSAALQQCGGGEGGGASAATSCTTSRRPIASAPASSTPTATRAPSAHSTTSTTPATSTAATTASTSATTTASTPTTTTATTPATTPSSAPLTTLTPLALVVAAPPTRSRRSTDLLSTKEVNSNSSSNGGREKGGRTPLKEGGAGSATRGSNSDGTGLGLEEMLLQQSKCYNHNRLQCA